ncbi:Protein DNPP-1 [Aphelenchoides avenae]|nr:Protein DNPP-1 [Aphelenchus avenae]
MSAVTRNFSQQKAAAAKFVEFLNKAVTPFHAVNECAKWLKSEGFQELREAQDFTVKRLGRYFIRKSETAIYAFAVGGAYASGNGFSIVVAHTDSPCYRIKPASKLNSEKFLQVGVAPYGGGLWRTWFDRDLSVAGQVIFNRDGKIFHRLVDIKKPILHIPNLAIHLETDRKTFEFNNETETRPILATQVFDDYATKELNKTTEEVKNLPISQKHHPTFLQLIANSAECSVEELLNFDLFLYDTQPAAITGLHDEFIAGARLDNLVGTYTSIGALISGLEGKSLEHDPNIRLVACFNHEEVGSVSASGAASNFTEWLLRRLCACNIGEAASTTNFELAMSRSYLISADQAHAAHPNYGQKHEQNHKPSFHGGVVVKINVNQRYATTAMTEAILQKIADDASVPLQEVCVRNDSPCGSTVGPILSARLGLQTIDVGCPQFAMHSIRELSDTSSISDAISLYEARITKIHDAFFKNLPSVLESVTPFERAEEE